MRVTLTVIDGPHAGQEFSFADHDTFLVGRSRRAHFRLPAKDKYFSRVHFLVEVNPPQCRLMDMDSRNGTHVNGARVEAADLKDGDQIRAGHTTFRLRFEESAAEPAIAVNPDPASAFAIPLPDEPELLADSEPIPVVPVAAVCPGCDAVLPAGSLGGLCDDCEEQARAQEQPIAGYRILRRLGKGAMGVVYLAIREADNSPVALKTLIPAVASTPAQVDRFLREARILCKLCHPNIVAFRDSGESGGKIFFAMDYVRGHDAWQLLRTEGPLPVGRAVALIGQLLEALDYAHGNGFVHRDVKPANLLLAVEGGREVVRLADFGLARVYQASQMSGLTVTGEVGGTVAFMAPEQITNYREVRPPVDQYAAAATLYNLLTGHYIYDLPRDFPRQLALILNEDPVPIRTRRPDLPPALASAIHQALARDPGGRYPGVRDFHAVLSRFARS